MQWWHKGLIKTQLHVILKSGEFTCCKLSIPSFIFCGFGTRVGELHPARVRGRHLPTRARGLARVHNVFPALSTADARYLSTRSGCVSAHLAGVERTVGGDPVFFGMMMHLSQAPNNQGLLARCPSFPSTTTLRLILPVRGLAVTLPYVAPFRAEPGVGYFQSSDALRGPLGFALLGGLLFNTQPVNFVSSMCIRNFLYLALHPTSVFLPSSTFSMVSLERSRSAFQGDSYPISAAPARESA